MIFSAAIISSITALFLLLFFPKFGVLFTVMVRPIIDASWDKYFLGTNFLQIMGVAVPLLVLPRIMFSSKPGFFGLALPIVGTFYILSNLLGTIGIIAGGRFVGAAEYFFRALNGFLGFYMFQFYFADREKFKRLLFFILLAGLFPMAAGVYQAATGEVWHFRTTAGGLVRNVGLYHDVFNIRFYGFQTITGILLYMSYFSTKSTLKKLSLLVYALTCCLVIFKGYSKAAMVIFAAWTLLWSMFNRKALWLLLVPLFIFSVNYLSGNKMFQDVEAMFSKEIGAYEGTMDDRFILSGRTGVWEHYLEEWNKQNIVLKMFGSGRNPPAHNEYIRILYSNGLIGLMILIGALLVIGIKLTKNFFSRASPLNVMGLMVFAMWLVDSLGLHPGMYPAYQWYVWGFVGLALRGVDGLDDQPGGIKLQTRPAWTGSRV